MLALVHYWESKPITSIGKKAFDSLLDELGFLTRLRLSMNYSSGIKEQSDLGLCYLFSYTNLNFRITLKGLSIGTLKTIDIPHISNGKLMVFRCSSIQAHCNWAVMCPDFGTPENN